MTLGRAWCVSWTLGCIQNDPLLIKVIRIRTTFVAALLVLFQEVGREDLWRRFVFDVCSGVVLVEALRPVSAASAEA